MKPLYIWAGGKNKMLPKYNTSPGIPLSGYSTYAEPFFGAGAMMIHIYENAPHVERFIINDIKAELMGIYTAIKHDVERFVNRMDAIQANYLPLDKPERKKFYYALRDEYTLRWTQWDKTEESATLYFLMKTGFNGIWQSTKEAQGRYATPCGLLNQTDSVYDKPNVYEWHTFLQRAEIHTGDWKDAVKDVSDAFVFLDPPYRDSFTSYSVEFNDSHQEELLEYCGTTNNTVFLCNRDAGDTFFTDRLGNLNIQYYDVTYTAGRRKKEDDGSHSAKNATEVLIHNFTKQDNFFDYE